MKMIVIFGLSAIFLLASPLQFILAFESEQEPEPIRMPNPVPVPDPLPGETESQQIQRLTKENDELKQQNIKLEIEISTLKTEN